MNGSLYLLGTFKYPQIDETITLELFGKKELLVFPTFNIPENIKFNLETDNSVNMKISNSESFIAQIIQISKNRKYSHHKKSFLYENPMEIFSDLIILLHERVLHLTLLKEDQVELEVFLDYGMLKRPYLALCRIVNLLAPFSSSWISESESCNEAELIHQLFDFLLLKKHGLMAESPSGMLLELYPFQKRTLYRLIELETQELNIPNPFFTKVANGVDSLWIHKISGECFWKKPMISRSKGGILAEEMGLGKTIEILSLVLANPRLAVSSNKIKSTLIIVPSIIKTQWINEIRNHAPQLSCLVYHQQSHDILKDYDIIITTFDILRKEIHVARPKRDIDLRKKQSAPKKSSLVEVEWWRVVFDESQNTCHVYSSLAEMARLLNSVNRWAVSGTPVGNTLDDLFGIFVFLDIKPFSTRIWWNFLTGFCKATTNPIFLSKQYFFDFISRFMIRNTMKAVSDELNLPNQEEIVLWLEFSQIERCYYNQILTSCKSCDKDDEFQSIFLQLRQTCCHPIVGSKNERILGSEVRSLTQVLQKMIEDSHSLIGTLERKKISLLFRLSMIQEIRKSFAEALKGYTDILNEIQSLKSETEDRSNQLTQERQLNLSLWKELEHLLLFSIASVHLELKNDAASKEYFEKAEVIKNDVLDSLEKEINSEHDRLVEFIKNNEKAKKSLEFTVSIPFHDFISSSNRILLNNCINLTCDSFKQIWETRQELLNRYDRPLCTDYSEDAEYELESHRMQDDYVKMLSVRKALLNDMSEEVSWKRIIAAFRGIDDKVVIGYCKEIYDSTKMHEISVKLKKSSSASEEAEKFCFQLLEVFKLYEACKSEDFFNFTEEIKKIFQKAALSTNHSSLFKAFGEFKILHKFLIDLQDSHKVVQETVEYFEKELYYFRKVWNARIPYFKKLQELSDAVAIPQISDLAKERQQVLRELEGLNSKILSEKSRFRYLNSLSDEDQTCFICRLNYTNGVLTRCGHRGCRSCMHSWIEKHRKCPLCATRL